LNPLKADTAKKAILLSELLLQLAKEGEWQRFEALLPQRDKVIAQLTTQQILANQADRVRDVINQIKMLDAQTHKLAATARQQVLGELRADAKQKQGISAYQKAQRRY